MSALKFGCQLPQESGDFDKVIEAAKECERLGYDSVWACDHLSPFWTRSKKMLECWTVLAAVATGTSTIKIGSLVTNVNFRHPSLLAKMSSTVDDISDGRLILGLGTGDRMSRQELLSYGYEFATLNERVARLKETILILKAMWTQDEATFNGKYYRITGAVNFPKPKQNPHPQIWIGGKHRKILDLIAEFGDGWNYWNIDSLDLKQRVEYLYRRCEEIGRRPDDIIRSWSGTLSQIFKRKSDRYRKIEAIRQSLRSQADSGAEYFIAHFGPNPDPDIFQIFAEAAKGLR